MWVVTIAIAQIQNILFNGRSRFLHLFMRLERPIPHLLGPVSMSFKLEFASLFSTMAKPIIFFFFFCVWLSGTRSEMFMNRRDIIYPPIDSYPTFPAPTPTIINVPSTNPFINQPPAFPVPGAQPVTNPVTTYPIPSTTPVTTPTGQSWCVAKGGVPETELQSAIDYACGMADCSSIQVGGSCYNPDTLQYHASYAFNSYYQMNPVQTSCDFGGTAMTTFANPSTGTCVFPASSSTSSTPTPTPTPTTSSTTGVTIPSGVSPPPPPTVTMVNTSYPDLGGGDSGTPLLFPGESPPIATDSSISIGPRISSNSSFIIIIILVMLTI